MSFLLISLKNLKNIWQKKGVSALNAQYYSFPNMAKSDIGE